MFLTVFCCFDLSDRENMASFLFWCHYVNDMASFLFWCHYVNDMASFLFWCHYVKDMASFLFWCHHVKDMASFLFWCHYVKDKYQVVMYYTIAHFCKSELYCSASLLLSVGTIWWILYFGTICWKYTLVQFDETICLFAFSEWLMGKMCVYTIGSFLVSLKGVPIWNPLCLIRR